MGDLIQKSVRLPDELVDYVELQEGRTFSQKLVHLLTEIRKGDADRQRILADYDKRIDSRRHYLNELQKKIYDASEILRRLSSPLSYADGMIEKSKTEETGN